MKSACLLLCSLLLCYQLYAQEEKHHEIAVAIGHAHISKGLNESGDRKWLIAASWSLDYNYNFNKKWSLGLHNDIILDDFEVEREEKVINRSFPVSSCLVGAFRPVEKLAVMLGAGGEFASGESFFLGRIGVEYGVELPKSWELSPGITYDIKFNGYDTWVVSLGIGKKF
ncbi:hypothetical protein SAMN05444266_11188 [Chitinophaga jiangningensis]|uniref:Outer membrane protein beta-barrel domain-containing protein n=1 Tax=Chitinophaga jiangningensis TaxID=1419482 RepID=A0A1M7LQB7_9BACT|nr:hypothetical protein [Chitinophaga jiangningensis]SHM80461.1 hypothetical protein SAMN05444266_11188 [Chitinophaga jiangningensis]